MDRVSFVIPVYNEARHIRACLDSISAQDVSRDQLEIVIADGGSTDGTLREIDGFRAANPSLSTIVKANPARNTATGRNLCIHAASGSLVMNFSGHAVAEPGLVRILRDKLQRQPVEVVAVGAAVTVGGDEEGLGHAIGRVLSSPILSRGSTDSNFNPDREQFARSIAFALYRRGPVMAVGGFDENFWCGQDAELNHRLRRNGYAILCTPDTRVVHYKRKGLGGFVRQMYRYGAARALILRKHPDSFRWIYLLPSLFTVVLLAGSIGAAFNNGVALFVAGGLAMYAAATFMMMRAGGAGNTVAATAPVVYGALGLGYGIGFLRGLSPPRYRFDDGKPFAPLAKVRRFRSARTRIARSRTAKTANLAMRRGEWQRAGKLWKEVIDLSHGLDDSVNTGVYYYKLGLCREKSRHWRQAADSYRRSLASGSDTLDVRLRLSLALYNAGSGDEALDVLFRLIVEYGAPALGEQDLERLFAVASTYRDVVRNYEYVKDRVEEIGLSDHQSLALAVLAWMLGVPTVVFAVMKRRLAHGAPAPWFAAKLARYGYAEHRAADSGAGKGKRLYLLDANVDTRVLYDIARSAPGNVVCVMPRQLFDNIVRSGLAELLDGMVEIRTKSANVEKYTLSDRRAANQCRAESRFLMDGLIRFIDDDDHKARLGKYEPVLRALLQARIYNGLREYLSCLEYIRRIDPEFVCVVNDNGDQGVMAGDLPGWIGKRGVYSCYAPSVASFHFRDDESRAVPNGTPSDSYPAALEQLIGGCNQLDEPLFRTAGPATVVVANYQETDRSTGGFLRPLLTRLLEDGDCVAVQRAPLDETRETAARELIAEIADFNGSHQLYSWLEPSEVKKSAALISRRPDVVRLSDHLAGRTATSDARPRSGYVKRIWRFFIRYDLPWLMMLGRRAESSFKRSHVENLLLVGNGRSPVCGVWAIAAREHEVASFDYNFAFISNHPMYTASMADYFLVRDSYDEWIHRTHLGAKPEAIRIVGSHVVDARRSRAGAMRRSREREKLGIEPDGPFVVLFAAQYVLSESMEALRELMEASRGLPVHIVVKLHPSESSLVAAEYRALATERGEAPPVQIREEGDLTGMMVAADLVVTLYSNAGLEAAVLGRKVLTLQFDKSWPVDLGDLGLTATAGSRGELRAHLVSMLETGRLSEPANEESRFLRDNPQLRGGTTEERIAKALRMDRLERIDMIGAQG